MTCKCNKFDTFSKRSLRYIGTMIGTTLLLPITLPGALIEHIFCKNSETICKKLIFIAGFSWLGLITVLPFMMAVGDAPLQCSKCGFNCN